jgi:hypothetical protein
MSHITLTSPTRPYTAAAGHHKLQRLNVFSLLRSLPSAARNDQIKHSSIPSLEFIPNTAPATLLIQMTVLDQVAEMLLQRVSADTRQFDRITNPDAPVLARKFDDLHTVFIESGHAV